MCIRDSFLGGRHVLGYLSVGLCEEGVQGSGFVKGPLRESAVVGYLGNDGTSEHRHNSFRRAAGASDPSQHGLQILVDKLRLGPLVFSVRFVVPYTQALEAMLLFERDPGGLPVGVVNPEPFV